MNDGYVFSNYFEVFRAFAFKAKEPVAHPVLRRDEQVLIASPVVPAALIFLTMRCRNKTRDWKFRRDMDRGTANV